MGLHLHEMRDTDKHFIIDPVTRAITNANAAKNKLIQFDHNSEIFTFEIPQYVDGHDMNKCDKVEIHYINIDGKTKEQSKDLFNAKAAAKTDSDLVFNLEGEKLLFCWKISGNATKYSGSLNFLVCFSCLDDAGAITYKWHTDIFKGITISDGLSNTEAVAEQYSDVLEQWKKELENASGSGSGSGGSYVVNIIDNGDDTFRTDKTFAQIHEAITAGKEAVCVFGTYHYQLVSCTDTKIVFSLSECEGVISYKTFTIDNTNGDGEVIYKFDMPGYQYSTDGNLQTEDITVVGAINEVNAKVNRVINNGTVVSENADFAEVGEWSDGNPNNEDRIGYFVSVDTSEPGKMMVKATSSSDVRGVTMLHPAFAGNASTDKYDSDGNLMKQYDYVGFAGFVPVIDNGTCEVNGRCMPADDGTAVPSSNNLGYQVIERIDSTHVLVLVEAQADMMVRIKEDVSQLSEEITDCIKSPVSAAVDQTIKVSAVDESGKPTEWEAVDMQEQVQPDWNQNDSTAADYVKNRTHYTKMVTVLEYGVLSGFGDNGESTYELPYALDIIDDSKTEVTWDNQVYQLTARQVEDVDGDFDGGFIFIGNNEFLGGENSGEPFGIIINKLQGFTLVMSIGTGNSHEVGIIAEIPARIKPRFLPSNIVYSKNGLIPINLVIPYESDIFGSPIAIGGKESTLTNPYRNKVVLNSLTLETFNAMLDGTVYLPRSVLIDFKDIASVNKDLNDRYIRVLWSEHTTYAISNYELAGAHINIYDAKIHEDADNPGTIVSEYAMITAADKRLT